MSILYLATLLLALGCLVLLDRRFRLFFWRAPRRATLVLVIGVVFFTAWDLLGIGFGVFARGEGVVSTGIVLAPELPIEELVFLTFLCYLTMILVLGFEKLLARRRMLGEGAVAEMTYAILSLAFLLGAVGMLVAAVITRGGHRIRPLLLPMLLAGIALLVLTAVFDNVMIGLGIMQYSDEAISGLRVGLAPIEDFAYPLAGLILLPSLWLLLDREEEADER